MHFRKVKNYRVLFFLTVLCLVISSCNPDPPKVVAPPPVETQAPTIPEIKFTVVNQYPHDVTSFTEGLLYYNGKLYESTGAPDNLPQTKSLFGELDLKSGKINVKAELDRNIYFGEGIAFLNDKVYQLTYKNQTGFIYDAKNFKNIGKFNYTNREGWGMTTDGTSLIMSDGTSYLTYLDPVSFNVTKTLDVAENGYVIEHLNELEFIKGFIYANIYTTNTIVKIDPATGDVVAKLDLTSLMYEARTQYANALEMNGIAYDSISNKVLVTGKMWPTIYEIQFPL